MEIARAYGFEMDDGLLLPLVVGTWSPDLGYGPVKELLARSARLYGNLLLQRHCSYRCGSGAA